MDRAVVIGVEDLGSDVNIGHKQWPGSEVRARTRYITLIDCHVIHRVFHILHIVAASARSTAGAGAASGCWRDISWVLGGTGMI